MVHAGTMLTTTVAGAYYGSGMGGRLDATAKIHYRVSRAHTNIVLIFVIAAH